VIFILALVLPQIPPVVKAAGAIKASLKRMKKAG
jgi:hypothetical protein